MLQLAAGYTVSTKPRDWFSRRGEAAGDDVSDGGLGGARVGGAK